MKCVFCTKIWFVKTSARIGKYESQVVKSNSIGENMCNIQVSISRYIITNMCLVQQLCKKHLFEGMFHFYSCNKNSF